MEENNNKQNIRIAELSKDMGFLKDEISDIKKRVTNEIPHQIECLRKDFSTFKDSHNKWLVGILVSMIFLLISQFLK